MINIYSKIITYNQINYIQKNNKKIVFTNGCFDILHKGHAEYLEQAKTLGDILIVGINSDESIKKIKGEKRPIIEQSQRLYIISSLYCVDYVILFNEETPIKIIEKLKPDILVKGGDWEEDNIIGANYVKSYGGIVKTIPFNIDISTSKIINIILERYGEITDL